ncbi:MAG: hypothetical protein IJ976_05075 [Alistipes sp.]|nr:hypothetical protein [Alistipes sp.]
MNFVLHKNGCVTQGAADQQSKNHILQKEYFFSIFYFGGECVGLFYCGERIFGLIYHSLAATSSKWLTLGAGLRYGLTLYNPWPGNS